MNIPNVSARSAFETGKWDVDASGYAWLAACLVGYVSIVLAISGRTFGSLFVQYLHTLTAHLPQVLGPICVIGLLFRIRAHGISSSLQFLRHRLPLLGFAIGGMLLVLTAYTTFKILIPDVVPFYADEWAARFDARLHGVVPWQWAHSVWPDSWSSALMVAYGKIWFVYWIATPLYVALWLRPDLARQYLWAFLLTLIICGNVLALMFSSVGPIYYDHFITDPQFEEFQASLKSLDGSESVLIYANYLLGSYESGDNAFGTGISAIPSMHVAVVVLNAWLFSQLNRIAGTLAWGFALLIQFGSVYTGWHYAIDGYLSAIVVTAIWAGVQRLDRSAWSLKKQKQALT